MSLVDDGSLCVQACKACYQKISKVHATRCCRNRFVGADAAVVFDGTLNEDNMSAELMMRILEIVAENDRDTLLALGATDATMRGMYQTVIRVGVFEAFLARVSTQSGRAIWVIGRESFLNFVNNPSRVDACRAIVARSMIRTPQRNDELAQALREQRFGLSAEMLRTVDPREALAFLTRVFPILGVDYAWFIQGVDLKTVTAAECLRASQLMLHNLSMSAWNLGVGTERKIVTMFKAETRYEDWSYHRSLSLLGYIQLLTNIVPQMPEIPIKHAGTEYEPYLKKAVRYVWSLSLYNYVAQQNALVLREAHQRNFSAEQIVTAINTSYFEVDAVVVKVLEAIVKNYKPDWKQANAAISMLRQNYLQADAMSVDNANSMVLVH